MTASCLSEAVVMSNHMLSLRKTITTFFSISQIYFDRYFDFCAYTVLHRLFYWSDFVVPDIIFGQRVKVFVNLIYYDFVTSSLHSCTGNPFCICTGVFKRKMKKYLLPTMKGNVCPVRSEPFWQGRYGLISPASISVAL